MTDATGAIVALTTRVDRDRLSCPIGDITVATRDLDIPVIALALPPHSFGSQRGNHALRFS